MGGTTGDIKNNWGKLEYWLNKTYFPDSLYIDSQMILKNPVELTRYLLVMLHFIVLDYSQEIATFINEKGYKLAGKHDYGFIECLFRLLRNEFDMKIKLAPAQFLSDHFSECKIILTAETMKRIYEEKNKIIKNKRLKNIKWIKPYNITKYP